ncbi:hypothetical protein [Halopenitus persicus]|uniref:Uncharacterized protein n=1 Tax=Halopenitus persicus TaxID=1048396 RepID=A0A1H3HTN2_9EURY|nr:hypothetical protein [Halopenitus persicus]SDY18069.1 hypothetical protein SAMN05216564_103403 [Halopenitus persicus]
MGTVTVSRTESLRYTWGAGIAGGFVGGVGMGLILHLGANMMPLIGALYGRPTVVGGWVGHLVNSVLIGLLFTLLVSRPVVRRQLTTTFGCLVSGVVYAAAVGLATTGIMLPISMNVLGRRTIPEPILPLPGMVGGMLVVLSVGVAHLVYGLLLGATYGVIHTRPDPGDG